MGEVVQFPLVRSCFLCQHHALLGDGSSRCLLFDEPIESEIFSAKNCEGYEP